MATKKLRANGKQDYVNETNEELLLKALPYVTRVVRNFKCTYPWIDDDDMKGYIYEQLCLYIKRFDPKKGNYEAFIHTLIRSKGRNYIQKMQRIREHEMAIKNYEKDDGETTDIEFMLFKSDENVEDKVSLRYDVERLFEIADEEERQVMIAVMSGYSLGQTAQLLGFGYQYHSKVRRILDKLSKKLKYNPLA